jgi:phosphatidylinositol-bisphosphatase
VAQQLAEGLDSLDDTLILRLENGRDHFLSVTANYLNSCFGCSLQKLVFYNDPIRTCKKTELMKVLTGFTG